MKIHLHRTMRLIITSGLSNPVLCLRCNTSFKQKETYVYRGLTLENFDHETIIGEGRRAGNSQMIHKTDSYDDIDDAGATKPGKERSLETASKKI